MSPSFHTLRTESLEATFCVSPRLLGLSLRHRGVELLRAIEDIERSATLGLPCGIPLLHPWANRLEQHRYAAAGKQVNLDARAPLLRADAHGLPLHGVPWSLLPAFMATGDANSLVARIDWHDVQLLTVFPYVHSLSIHVSVQGASLTISTELHACGSDHVPVSFGFHPYFGLPGTPRETWRLGMPERERLLLDARGIPTGASHLVAATNAALGETSFDDAFAVTASNAEYAIFDNARRIRVQCMEGYTHVHVYAPPDEAFVCIEPMTAPVNALCSGLGLRIVAPGERFCARFSITVEDVAA